MRIGAFVVFLLLLFPFQATFMHSLSPWTIRPDLCLITVFLVGLWAGRGQGVVVGVAVGLVQGVFSASPLWLNLLTKAGAGFLAGTIAKNLSNMESPLAFFPIAGLSFVWGIVFLLSSRTGTDAMLYSTYTLLLPQAVMDGLVAIGLHWVVARWIVTAPAHEGWARVSQGGLCR